MDRSRENYHFTWRFPNLSELNDFFNAISNNEVEKLEKSDLIHWKVISGICSQLSNLSLISDTETFDKSERQ